MLLTNIKPTSQKYKPISPIWKIESGSNKDNYIPVSILNGFSEV